ncbi:uncharacterized protein LOC129402272 isoform X2 [Sorex araneus]|uniref:uncharacterized protein LOC129402272 isoform X2 n=1 Tax=Sorex araneus TaxID=42254 RepID=UPI00243404C3|nr:uncharacterized protein LOC129402272 isoform X2 [Sorex araneus]
MRPAPRGARQGPLAEPSGNCARAPAPGKWEGGGGEARAPGSPQVQRAPRLPGRPSDSLPRLPDAGPPGCTSRCSKRERPRDAGEVAAGAGKDAGLDVQCPAFLRMILNCPNSYAALDLKASVTKALPTEGLVESGIKNRGTMTQEDADFYPEKSAWICQFPKVSPGRRQETEAQEPLPELTASDMKFGHQGKPQ